VIVAVDSRTAPMTESQFMAYVRLNHPPGDSVRLTVLRGQQKEELTMRLE
jgi:S1-C subfamily serine protease